MATAHLRYHYEPEGWWADSPEFPGYSAFCASLDQVRLLAHEGLRFFADDDALDIIDPISDVLTALTIGAEPEMETIPYYVGGSPRLDFSVTNDTKQLAEAV